MMAPEITLQNRQLMGKLLVITVLMLGFGFAMVPMYRQICEALGITQSRTVGAVNTQVDTSRTVSVEMVASSAAGLSWKFEALDRTLKLHPGELATVRYRVENTLGRPVTANARMSTAPEIAGRYIVKQECFCFSSQTLAAGEVREMPVVFRVSPDAPKDMDTVSLSYTFFEVKG
ncbi:cytochrome c oxidase assembly protein [Usitatibacter palustris]|uniref:Cytochrome c oxidase assembly protein CtaG n=1 Tax=Usitatibacter palustris TaxID=2732487 RepID=A0A6M4H2C4_9PROT|nr:cytochrome c oxidase assembly protein [Usitatibacter palustris]QJR13620.1 Cytochrome c oxidase assembly protein CtaG [Usitatibacter palustris]